MIYILLKSLPALFVENYVKRSKKDPTDGEFFLYVDPRPEYNGDHIRIRYIIGGKKKTHYLGLLNDYFATVDDNGVDVHANNLEKVHGLMRECLYDLSEAETLDPERDPLQPIDKPKDIAVS